MVTFTTKIPVTVLYIYQTYMLHDLLNVLY